MWPLSAPEITNADQHPRALILVRNTASHDSRVMREVETLGRVGVDVLVVGVTSTDERERRSTVAGARLVRIDPLARPHLRSRDSHIEAPRTGASSTSGEPPAPARRSRLRRLAVTTSYHLRAAAFAIRAAPTLVHANDFNTMWIAVAAKLLRGSRVIYDSHELWPDRNRRPEWRPWLLACESLFRSGLADATITTSPGYAQAIAARYRVPRADGHPQHPTARPAARPNATLLAPRRPRRGVCRRLDAPDGGWNSRSRPWRRSAICGSRFIGPGFGAVPRPSFWPCCAQAAGTADRVEVCSGGRPRTPWWTTVSAADLGLTADRTDLPQLRADAPQQAVRVCRRGPADARRQ